MADPLSVELVAADRKVWSGEATMVIARTVEGEIGILSGHIPVLGVLVDGSVRIHQEGGDLVVAAVHGGFLSVADNRVAILAELAEMADEIDIERAKASLEDARSGDGDEDRAAAKRAEVRIRAHSLGR